MSKQSNTTNNYNFIGRLVAIVTVATLIAAVAIVAWIPDNALSVLVPTFAFAVAITGIIINLKQSVDNGIAQQQTAEKVETIKAKVAIVEENTYNAVALVAQIGTVASETQSQVAVNTEVTDKTHLAVNSRMDQLIATVEAQGRAQEKLAAALALAQGIREGRAQVQAETEETP